MDLHSREIILSAHPDLWVHCNVVSCHSASLAQWQPGCENKRVSKRVRVFHCMHHIERHLLGVWDKESMLGVTNTPGRKCTNQH